MAEWPHTQIEKIASSDDFHIAPYRDDGYTPGTLTFIWSVTVDGQIYVRAYNGVNSRWYQSALAQQAGRITAGGLDTAVNFTPVEGPVNDQIDDAYRTKYTDSPYLAPMISKRARAATVRVDPADA